MDELPEPWGVNPPDDVPAGARVLLAIARLTPQKGIDVAVRALATLPDDTVLVVLGEGPGARSARVARTRARCREPPLPAGPGARRRRLAPPRDRARAPGALGGFGLGVLEAMLAGLPVVASNVSSLPELVVDGETGILVRPDDPSALGLGIARALEEPTRFGAAGLECARREFSVSRMADRTAELYRSL